MARKTYDLIEVPADNGKNLEEIKPSLKRWFEEILAYGQKLEILDKDGKEKKKLVVGDG